MVDWDEWRLLRNRVKSLGAARPLLRQLEDNPPEQAVQIMRELVKHPPAVIRRLNVEIAALSR